VNISDYDYELPEEYIAQYPVEPRDKARLMVIDRNTREIIHSIFRDINEYLKPNDVLVLNETRVIPARLFAKKLPHGGRVELLLLRKIDRNTWETLVGGKGLIAGQDVQVEAGPGAQIIADLGRARRLVTFKQPIEDFLPQAGNVPLPPYIKTSIENPERYQTVYAQYPGSAAAPTAGLHFTTRLLEELEQMGIGLIKIILHIGLDTFAPVTEEDPRLHKIHTEWCQIGSQAVEVINQRRKAGGRIIAVGTTSVRALESAAKVASPGECIGEFEGFTDLFILPGYKFKAVDAMVTNFHLPRSTLIMLVSAFAGREFILDIYQKAKQMNYRFFSFGDAMLIT